MKIEIQEIENKWNLYTLTNNNHMSVRFLDYGGIITEINVPDKNQHIENVVLGFKRYTDYENNNNFLGAIVGPVAGRIQGASFTLEDSIYSLDANEGAHHIHSGSGGFHQVIWETSPFQTADTVMEPDDRLHNLLSPYPESRNPQAPIPQELHRHHQSI